MSIESQKQIEQQIEQIEVLKARPLLSKKDYKTLTGLSLPTITRLCLAGELPVVKIGRSVRIKNNFCSHNA